MLATHGWGRRERPRACLVAKAKAAPNSGLNPTGKRAEGLTRAAMCPAGMAAAVLR
jgi:hypothetical protein